jgi:hypothetical protein
LRRKGVFVYQQKKKLSYYCHIPILADFELHLLCFFLQLPSTFIKKEEKYNERGVRARKEKRVKGYNKRKAY